LGFIEYDVKPVLFKSASAPTRTGNTQRSSNSPEKVWPHFLIASKARVIAIPLKEGANKQGKVDDLLEDR
jgi:hypothetical protein